MAKITINYSTVQQSKARSTIQLKNFGEIFYDKQLEKEKGGIGTFKRYEV